VAVAFNVGLAVALGRVEGDEVALGVRVGVSVTEACGAGSTAGAGEPPLPEHPAVTPSAARRTSAKHPAARLDVQRKAPKAKNVPPDIAWSRTCLS
jgi:hypothetical protein